MGGSIREGGTLTTYIARLSTIIWKDRHFFEFDHSVVFCFSNSTTLSRSALALALSPSCSYALDLFLYASMKSGWSRIASEMLITARW